MITGRDKSRGEAAAAKQLADLGVRKAGFVQPIRGPVRGRPAWLPRLLAKLRPHRRAGECRRRSPTGARSLDADPSPGPGSSPSTPRAVLPDAGGDPSTCAKRPGRRHRQHPLDQHPLRRARPRGLLREQGGAGLLTKNAAHAHRFDRIRVNGIKWAGPTRRPSASCRPRRSATGRAGSSEQRRSLSAACCRPRTSRASPFPPRDASGPMTGALIDQEQDFVIGVRED